MCPRFGLHAVVLDYMYKWSNMPNGSLSKLALQCLHALKPYKLGNILKHGISFQTKIWGFVHCWREKKHFIF